MRYPLTKEKNQSLLVMSSWWFFLEIDLESVSEGVKVKKPLHTYVKFISALSLSINYFCFLQSLNVVQRRISSTKIAFYIIFKFHQQYEKKL